MNISVNGERLWNSLMRMAEIGATQKGGVCRLALTDLDKEGRDLLSQWCDAERCERRIDPMGNMFFKRSGVQNSAHAVGMGSHLDTQPTGGKFDGVYGVLAALEVIRVLNEHDISTRLPVELVVWTNEEGARFPPAMIGSGVYAGAFDLEYGHGRADPDNKTIGDELKRIGYLQNTLPKDHGFSAFFEAHIEQGPILEAKGLSIGVVTGVQGVRWYDIEVTGEETHAGPMPMEMRKDAMRGAAKLLPEIYQIAKRHEPDGRVTIGEFHIQPGSRNTVPSKAVFSIDFRHPDETMFDQMHTDLIEIVEKLNQSSNVEFRVDNFWRAAPTKFNETCVNTVRRSAEKCGFESIDMVSGAGHDSVYIARVAPTAMIFIPCDDGVSHSEIENTSPEFVEAGANVLLHSILETAG